MKNKSNYMLNGGPSLFVLGLVITYNHLYDMQNQFWVNFAHGK
jgi:hypothetical protein